jgi:hypothetical protein
VEVVVNRSFKRRSGVDVVRNEVQARGYSEGIVGDLKLARREHIGATAVWVRGEEHYRRLLS